MQNGGHRLAAAAAAAEATGKAAQAAMAATAVAKAAAAVPIAQMAIKSANGEGRDWTLGCLYGDQEFSPPFWFALFIKVANGSEAVAAAVGATTGDKDRSQLS